MRVRSAVKVIPILVALALALAVVDGCGGGGVDPTPEDKNGVPSHEFEQSDIDRANNASQAVKDYCAGAVSEAQYVGCISHVDASDIP